MTIDDTFTIDEALNRLITRASTLISSMQARHGLAEQFDVELSELMIAMDDAWSARKGEAGRLIAAAPDMFDLLRQLNEAFYRDGTAKALKPFMAKTKPLLQRARGQQ